MEYLEAVYSRLGGSSLHIELPPGFLYMEYENPSADIAADTVYSLTGVQAISCLAAKCIKTYKHVLHCLYAVRMDVYEKMKKVKKDIDITKCV